MSEQKQNTFHQNTFFSDLEKNRGTKKEMQYVRLKSSLRGCESFGGLTAW